MTSLPNNSSTTTTGPTGAGDTNFDRLFLETLMNKLQLRGQENKPILDQSYEDFFFGEDDDDKDTIHSYQDSRQALHKEESKLENDIIKLILTGKTEALKPNSGEAIEIRENNICVGCHEEEGGEYRVWEWHGHIMCYTDEHGFSPEYIYGNYFQRIGHQEHRDAPEGDAAIRGLRDLIDDEAASTTPARILHRNLNAGDVYLHPRI